MGQASAEASKADVDGAPAKLTYVACDGGSAEPADRGPVRAPLGIIAPEWSLARSARGAALWRHAGVMNASAKDDVEVFALDREARGPRFTTVDQWNVPAAGARFRVRRVRAGGRHVRHDEFDRARLEGLVLEWVRDRRPRLAHVLDVEVFGTGLLWALDAASVPVVLTLDRVDGLRALVRDGEGAGPASALGTVRRVIVRSARDAAVAEAAGAPRERIRVLSPGEGGEIAVLRAYASLYRLIG